PTAPSPLSLHDALPIYSGALQTSLYAKVTVSGGATKDGKIDYDQDGKLVGNWVLTGHRPTDPSGNALAFVYNVSNHAPRISAGSDRKSTRLNSSHVKNS